MTTLSKLAEDQYRWETAVDFALGPVRPNDLALVISRFIAAGEGLSEQRARASIASSMPKTRVALGNGFSLDSIRPTVLPDGSTAVSIAVGIHTDQLRARFPALSDYTHKYIDPARLRMSLTDRSGVSFMETQLRDKVLTIRLRTQNGHLVPLTGASRPLPDTLVMLMDFTVKVKLFHVGFHDLSMEFVNSGRGDVERSWTVTARKEPKWNLPLISARLLRSPLRRPFAGEGAMFRMGIRADAGDQTTVLIRQARLVVEESTILRFINSLTSKAMDDFGARVGREQNQWLRELFTAMRDDARGVISP